MIVTLFYKYVELKSIDHLQETILTKCQEIGLKGRILLATEGINGSVSGSEEQVQTFQKYLQSFEQFRDIEFKDEETMHHPFKKMNIKLRKEICNFGQNVDLKEKGKYLEPHELLEWYKSGKQFTIMDARNNYESKIGRFKNAITPNIETFREFPKAIDALKGKEEEEVVIYCTGGIRCEKASAYLKQQGFKNVYHIHGGIIKFIQTCPNTVWEGANFVFDRRIVVPSENPITNCEICNTPHDQYVNCKNPTCDKFTILCPDCKQKMNGCCSEKCKEEHALIVIQKRTGQTA
jgi:UPF0176 protein